MKYYIYVEDNILKGAGCARCLNKEIQNIEVTETLCTDYISDNDKYIYSEEKIIPNPNYEKILKERNKSEKISKIIEKLNELDNKRIRAVCENQIKDTQTGETWLEYYNSQANKLRNELQAIE